MSGDDGFRPELHIIAGSNGSGKSTLIDADIRHRHPGLPFVNADNLALEHYGHSAVTREEATTGQRLANEMRDELLDARASFLTETTFSHESKIKLLQYARSIGYGIVVYQVGLRSADLAVERVALRVSKGGHPVPEEKTRARWERSLPLIRDAVRMADRAYVYDNSAQDQPHRIALIFNRGQLVQPPGSNVPAWVSDLYADELRGFTPKLLNPARHSFSEAKAIGQGMLGDQSRIFVAKAQGTYTGEVLAKTDLHTLQQVGKQSGIAHLSRKLDREPELGSAVRITYTDAQHAIVTSLLRSKTGSAEDRKKAEAFRDLPPKAAAAKYPDLANAYAMVSAFSTHLDLSGHPATKGAVRAFELRLQRHIAAGQPLPQVGIKEAHSIGPRSTKAAAERDD